MNALDIIIKKRDGLALTRAELYYFVNQYVAGEIPDYQAAAFAMAVYFQGMNDVETADLTLAIVESGDQVDISAIRPGEIVVDKHSTGGVGDKTTLIVLPMVAACGLPVGKMSGRGLGFSGGTLDKLDSIPGFDTQLSSERFAAQLREHGIVLVGATGDLTPADRKLYALRDVTGTVPSMPLISSSIMSKKLAGGAQAIVLDVKVGKGSFMKTVEDASELAQRMVNIGKETNRQTVAVLSSMDQPLGNMIGNALEVREVIDVLKGGGPADLIEHSVTIAGHMLVLGGIADDLEAGKRMAQTTLTQGYALKKFQLLLSLQGANTAVIDDPSLLPTASLRQPIYAATKGTVAKVDALQFGEAAVKLGAGRAKKSDTIDYAVGFEVLVQVGDTVNVGDPLYIIHANDAAKIAQATMQLQESVEIVTGAVESLPQFLGVVS